jgi:hypothetical protein
MSTEIEFAKAIEIIATDLGVAAERIFEIFVSVQVMIGIIEIAAMIAGIGSTYLVGKYVRKQCLINFKDEDGSWNYRGDATDAIAYPVIAGLLTFVLVCGFSVVLGDALLKIAYPEYTAMREILNLVT